MAIKTLMITVALTLFFLVIPQTARAQKDGEAQSVFFGAGDQTTLRFANNDPKEQQCGAFVTHTPAGDGREDTIALRVAHMHVSGMNFFPSVREVGWLYITPSRIVFSVEEGDKSHAFDIPRTVINEKKPFEQIYAHYEGIQINLKEKLPGSNSSKQKFIFFLAVDKHCRRIVARRQMKASPYRHFIQRTVKDFDGAVAEFKQLTASLKQSGRIQKAPASMLPPSGFGQAPDAQIARDGVGLGLGGGADAGVDMDSEPDGAEIYADGKLIGITPARAALSAGEHTIKVTKPGYKDWEQKINVERGSVKRYDAVLEKQ